MVALCGVCFSPGSVGGSVPSLSDCLGGSNWGGIGEAAFFGGDGFRPRVGDENGFLLAILPGPTGRDGLVFASTVSSDIDTHPSPSTRSWCAQHLVI